MKKMILSLVIMSSSYASANVISVAFKGCSDNQNVICADVYGDQTTGMNYGGEEMKLDYIQDTGLLQRIDQLIGQGGRSVAMNIEGKVSSMNKFASGGRSYNFLTVNGFSQAGPRPRGL